VLHAQARVPNANDVHYWLHLCALMTLGARASTLEEGNTLLHVLQVAGMWQKAPPYMRGMLCSKCGQ
jgi:hypothetical protein